MPIDSTTVLTQLELSFDTGAGVPYGGVRASARQVEGEDSGSPLSLLASSTLMTQRSPRSSVVSRTASRSDI